MALPPLVAGRIEAVRPIREKIMFRSLCLAAACAISLTISAPSVQADEATPLIDKRLEHQKDRIKQGVKSGELTRKEAGALIHGQKRIHRMKKNAAADGEITDQERRRIRRARKRQSAKIYRKKHNRRNRR